MKDAIIVGGGISGCVLAWTWYLQGKEFVWYLDDKKGSSHVAAGVYNPVVLKRFSPVWQAADQLNVLQSFYPQIEKLLGIKVSHPIEIWRRLHDEAEIKTWKRKSQREDLNAFMSNDVFAGEMAGVFAPYGFGKVLQSGWLDVNVFIEKSLLFFTEHQKVRLEELMPGKLQYDVNSVSYNGAVAHSIIWAQGYAAINNPETSQLPMQGNKGELLLIRCTGLKLDSIIKSSVFLMPYTDDLFWVGATYDRDDLSKQTTTHAREWLEARLQQFLKLPYEVVEHKTGIRPTTVDRRPFLGSLQQQQSYVFNGMGSRASLVAPWAAQLLFNHIYNHESLPLEMDIARFNN
ncbi:NAD(P)/FAD-dependent oxidoreductase [Nonlabens ponticola]|uniref:FAD-dependent oxidoreductase n=1 Tax=Nonlabens ponticola TaxID=2496866 RepID=A0A3S9MU89_9FLAO|nr:FAD-dependent oxidoreductase [Nonlabens ponticola]AZQ42723.1 FAD-dependent oxidoreductase [Nonlabens ponticola]